MRLAAVAAALLLLAGGYILYSDSAVDHAELHDPVYQVPVTNPMIEPDRPDLLGEPRINDEP